MQRMNLPDPEATLCTLHMGSGFSYLRLHMNRMTRLGCDHNPSFPVRSGRPPQTGYRYWLIGPRSTRLVVVPKFLHARSSVKDLTVCGFWTPSDHSPLHLCHLSW